MFPRNRATEKINLLEFGGSSAMVMDKVKSDSTFNLIFAGAFLASLVLMGGITGILAIKDATIKHNIKEMNDYLNDPQTAADLLKRENRLALQEQVKEYKRTATLASDALATQPYIKKEVYDTIEKTVEETISQAKVSGLSFNPKDNGKDKFKIESLNYEDGIITFNYSALADKSDPVMTFATLLAENLEKKDYFEEVDFNGFDVIEGEDQTPGEGGLVDPSALNKDQKGVHVAMTMKLKSPVELKDLGSYTPVAEETEGTNE
jgi:hypothetical protein